ncbi:hypothetical protein TL16_g07834 [Triparma laevis f. inornata]|uniref:Uncharacterized protein n=2 Tax=Triparma laevis TaxID=1534972 RepID=A0A9W7CIN5_9STRA|nr:hypothetical protein TL16_g07834 [Triparma laevis f. inornata]GMI06831.1 hypothetical protein TrLO_g15372 [Triparma laevis f. longispina]
MRKDGYWNAEWALLGLLPLIVVSLSRVCIAERWIDNDLANAFILVLSGLGILSFLCQIYLWREYVIAESANEDFAKKRQENSMFFFLFFYTVAYLSGVSACTKLLVGEATSEKVAGGILLPFYVFVPLWMQWGGAASAKAAVNEAASEEGHPYDEIKATKGGIQFTYSGEIKMTTKMVIETTGTKVIGGGEIKTYKDSLGVFGKTAVESKTGEVTYLSERLNQRL